MKTIVSFIAFLMLAPAGYSQSGAVDLSSAQNVTKIDTLADATTDIQYTKTAISGGWKKMVVQVNLTRLSGTGAGTITPEVSTDGVNYKIHPSVTAATVANSASQTFLWELSDFAYTHVRLKYVGSGTQSMKWSSRIKYAGPL